MRTMVRDLMRRVEPLGWRLIGHTKNGAGHLMLQHTSGAPYTLPARSCNTRRRMLNYYTTMRRIARDAEGGTR